jgi:hypothetical protein
MSAMPGAFIFRGRKVSRQGARIDEAAEKELFLCGFAARLSAFA